MISASKAIMAIAAKARYNNDDSVRAIQNQTVNVTVQNSPTTTTNTNTSSSTSPASVINNTNTHTPQPPSEPPVSTFPEVIERDIQLEPETPEVITSQDQEDNIAKVYEELENLHAIVNNYETVAKALILIIELHQSNPLIINRIIIPTEQAFKELIQVLTSADEVEIRYSEEVSCSLSSKKYKLIEDIIVIKNTEPKSLKYSHPDIIRLFDRFNISVKMISKH